MLQVGATGIEEKKKNICYDKRDVGRQRKNWRKS
jgi:hypothetical protein